MNRIKKLLQTKNRQILSIYFTAGFPRLDDTLEICRALNDSGVDLVEIGIPFSDPVADGETIQKSNETALQNGMTMHKLFEQVSVIRKSCDIPIILMGYLNPIMQYGLEDFCCKCKELSIDGSIIPDLPPELYISQYKDLFEKNGLSNIFLITPQSSDQRIKYIDSISDGFIYAVSSAAVTGGQIKVDGRNEYLERVTSLKLNNPLIVGFGVSAKSDFDEICKKANGAIIGSAFIRVLSKANGNITDHVSEFVKSIKSVKSS